MKRIPVAFFILFLFTQTGYTQRPNIAVTKFRDSALAGAWCQYDSTLVAYDLYRPNGYYQIYLAHVGPGNSFAGEYCYSCLNAALPGKNYGQASFQPTGKYMLFTAEMAHHAGNSNNSIPGIGTYNNLWVMTMDGSKAYQLSNMPSTGLSAIIEPYFNPKGNEIMWCQMIDSVNVGVGKQEFGYWAIKTAPFIDDPINGPRIDSTHIKTFLPGGSPSFNEPYGWSPDGSKILFASDYNQFWVWDDQIYTMDTNGNNMEQISSTAHSYPYCEHAFYSTNGEHIVWMTDLDANVGSSVGGDDWFIMNSDTTDQERLTYFNDTTSSYWTGNIHVNGHGSYAPDNLKFIGDVGGSKPAQINFDSSIGAVYIITTASVTGIATVSQNYIQCNVYPNPASSTITIALNTDPENMHYSVYNVLGNKIIENQFGGKTSTIDISALSSGVYFLKVFNQNTVINKKFVVERK